MERWLGFGVVLTALFIGLAGCDGDDGDDSNGGSQGGVDSSYVGSQDCAELDRTAAMTAWCESCQGASCDEAHTASMCVGDECGACDLFPCVDGAIVVLGCDADAQCSGMGVYCGMGTSMHWGLCGADMGDM